MGKIKIIVLHPGALAGKTAGDVVEFPSNDEIAKAKASPGLLRLVEVKAPTD